MHYSLSSCLRISSIPEVFSRYKVLGSHSFSSLNFINTLVTVEKSDISFILPTLSWYFILDFLSLKVSNFTGKCLNGGSISLFIWDGVPFGLKIQGSLYFRRCVRVCVCLGDHFKNGRVFVSHNGSGLEVSSLTDDTVSQDGIKEGACLLALLSSLHLLTHVFVKLSSGFQDDCFIYSLRCR